jgi:hypothetical protein
VGIVDASRRSGEVDSLPSFLINLGTEGRVFVSTHPTMMGLIDEASATAIWS